MEHGTFRRLTTASKQEDPLQQLRLPAQGEGEIPEARDLGWPHPGHREDSKSVLVPGLG